MSKRSKAAKAAKKAARASTRPQTEAEFRASNGRATLQDVDFATRMRREVNGMDGYSGFRRSGRGTSGTSGTSAEGYHWSKEWDDIARDRGKVSSHILPIAKDDGVFCVESNEVTGNCPLNPKVPEILVDAKMWDSWLKATEAFNVEWIALLLGKAGFTTAGSPCYIIDSFYFPPQTATGAHVDVPTGVIPRPGVIGAIHSHVGMGVFWSATDKAHSNWPVEIVINRKHDYEALARFKLKCGEWAKGKATVYLTGSSLDLRVKHELDEAFKSGEEMERQARISITPLTIPATPAISTTPITTTTPTPTTVEPKQETLALTVPGSDDGSSLSSILPSSLLLGGELGGEEDNHKGGPIDPLEIEIDEYACKGCEGDGWVEIEVGHIKEIIECSKCGGSGLNPKGLELQASMLKDSKLSTKEKDKGERIQ